LIPTTSPWSWFCGPICSILKIEAVARAMATFNFTRLDRPCNSPASRSLRYQPELQFPGLADRLIFVNLYSSPTEIAKFKSNCVNDWVEGGAYRNV